MSTVLNVKNSSGQLNPKLEEYIQREVLRAQEEKAKETEKMNKKKSYQSMVMRFPKLKAQIIDKLDEEGFKSVFSTREIMDLMLLNNTIGRIETAIKLPLLPYEKKMLRTSLTYIYKTILSIYERVRESTRKEMTDQENTCFPVLVHTAEYNHLKQCIEYREKMIEEAWQDVLNLSEDIMHETCQGCTKNPGECRYYNTFIKHHFEDAGGSHYKGRQCKYGYIKKDGKVL